MILRESYNLHLKDIQLFFLIHSFNSNVSQHLSGLFKTSNSEPAVISTDFLKRLSCKTLLYSPESRPSLHTLRLELSDQFFKLGKLESHQGSIWPVRIKPSRLIKMVMTGSSDSLTSFSLILPIAGQALQKLSGGCSLGTPLQPHFIASPPLNHPQCITHAEPSQERQFSLSLSVSMVL